MNILIERAVPADAKAMLEYLRQIGGETDNLSFGSEGVPATIEEEASHIRRSESSCDDVIFVAKDNGRIIGDASLDRLPRRMRHRGELGLAVVREYWDQGIGSRLLSEIISFAEANAFEIIDLQVRSDNARAIHLYEKFGFQRLGTHKSYFKLGEVDIAFDYMYLKL